MLRRYSWAVALVGALAAGPAQGAGGKYSIKQADTPIPQDVSEPIRKLLADKSVQLLDDKGTVICELWFRAAVPVKATPEQLKNGLTYREAEESTVLGAVRFDQLSTDYRKQKIKPGLYTLRLGFQPMDGDHMGTAPYPEFCLLAPAKLDQKPDIMEAKELRELSAKAIGGSHPGVLLLFPNDKPEDAPKLVDKGNNTWVLTLKEPVTVDGQKADAGLGIALTLVGQTSAE
jgi:hypothetical protein